MEGLEGKFADKVKINDVSIENENVTEGESPKNGVNEEKEENTPRSLEGANDANVEGEGEDFEDDGDHRVKRENEGSSGKSLVYSKGDEKIITCKVARRMVQSALMDADDLERDRVERARLLPIRKGKDWKKGVAVKEWLVKKFEEWELESCEVRVEDIGNGKEIEAKKI